MVQRNKQFCKFYKTYNFVQNGFVQLKFVSDYFELT